MKRHFGAIACAVWLMGGAAFAQQIGEPGGDGAATQMAEFHSDEFAWQLFLFMNHPAKPGIAGIADGTKKLGDDAAAVVWETWALESGFAHSEVYKSDGSRPVPWDQLPRTARTLTLDRNLERESVLKPTSRFTPKFDIQSPSSQEVRANKAMFEFIVTRGLYNLDGLEKVFADAVATKARFALQFPQGSKEIKAQWNPIPEDQKSRYLWRNAVGPDGKARAYGLVSLHVITKDLTNWFWADFGHIDCEKQMGACDNQWLQSIFGKGIDPQEEARTPLSDITTTATGGVRKETQGTFWQNYRLRGTQTNFVSPIGQSTILSNPVIENGFQHSSCMTCHARAGIGQTAVVNGKPADGPTLLSPSSPDLGSPDEAIFGAAAAQGERTDFVQTDFIWSAPFRVNRCTVAGGCGN